VNNERVKFVKKLMVGRERCFNQGAQLFVAGRMRQAVAFEDAAGICVDYKNWMLAGVEKNGVGGFRADAAKGEQLIAQSLRGTGEEPSQRTSVRCIKKFDERLERFGFLAEVTGRTKEL